MIELAYVEEILPVVLHNTFEHHPSATGTFAAFSYETDLDWTKPLSCGNDDLINKREASMLHTTDTPITNTNGTRHYDAPIDNGYIFDSDQNQNQTDDWLNFDQPQGEIIFPNLPPLYRGQPGDHLRNGILNARKLAAAGEPDAEKAFFVADLSEVYNQHQRWTRCLPQVQPFYGMIPFFMPAKRPYIDLYQLR